ncbi:MAG: dinB [Sphingobacteriaceae bacterium]|jgi:DNA polymerase-4|nr:dinB [Sphingobacteriaceae bacterium]
MDDNKRRIVHIDLDSFFVSVERLNDKSLHGIPVLIGGSSDRGVVASCSYESRKFGIHSAMPMKTARRLCPHATIIGGNYTAYSKASREVTEIIRATVPIFEKTSIDEFYIDLSGMDEFYDSYKTATELRQTIIKNTGLPISFGLSTNKTVSKIATGQAKPNGQLFVEPGTEKAFLAPLPVGKIPMIGKKAVDRLVSMGIYKIADLQRQTPEHLQQVFGKMGLMMWEKANGIDRSQVMPQHERKSISSENTFFEDTTDVEMMQQLLIAMGEQLTYKLRNEGRMSACLTVKIRYSNFETFSQQMSMAPTHSDPVLFPLIKNLFAKAYQKGRAVRLIGLRLSNLTDGPYQANLFDNNERDKKLYAALDSLNSRFGKKTISRAATMEIKSRDFNPFNGETSD